MANTAIWLRALGANHYRFRKHMTQVFFSFDEEGVVRSTRGLAKLRGLASFQAHDRPLATGDRVSRTAGPHTMGGVVHLVHEDPDQVSYDLHTLREWESGGELYDIAGDDNGPEALIPRALSMQLVSSARSRRAE